MKNYIFLNPKYFFDGYNLRTFKKEQKDELYLYSWISRHRLIYDNLTLISPDTISQAMKYKYHKFQYNETDDTRNKIKIIKLLMSLEEKNAIIISTDLTNTKYYRPFNIIFNDDTESSFIVEYKLFDKLNSPQELFDFIVQKYDINSFKNDGVRRSIRYARWREEVLKSDNFCCQICKNDEDETFLHAHHKDGYEWCINRRTDITNGVTLCEDCHTEFHILYGHKGNTEQQYIEFYEDKMRTNGGIS